MSLPKLKPGDIILSRSRHWLSKAIRLFGKMQTGEARVSHCALALGDLTEEPEVIEALFKVVRRPLSKYEGQEIVIWRKISLSQAQRNEIALKCISVENQAYGLLKVPLFALDSITRSYFFTRTFGISSFKVCSNLIAWAYQKVLGNTVFGDQGWRSTTPDHIDDWCRNHPKVWKEVYSSLV